VHFGIAAYPKLTRANAKVWALRALLALGPAGTQIAKVMRGRVEQRWRARESAIDAASAGSAASSDDGTGSR
jgi:hypothetical protein